jgi:hypothetical protein
VLEAVGGALVGPGLRGRWVQGYVAGRIEAGLPTAADRIDQWDEDAPWPGDEAETWTTC